ncbi:SH2B adapter protein 2 [Rhincodon typus]|uniref:SH2B adapter protein 2 n=1 Tax=Rhincodon typus TaxID=259920 RepID=UPI002030AAB2|nr:SH2B adapter protein 2 [Rhincodon typus]
MNGDSESPDSLQHVPDWKEFCEVQARAAAVEFAQKFRIFISENPHYECPGIETTFSQHFASHFVEYFASEVNRPYLSDSPIKYNVAPFSDIQNCQLPYGKEILQRKVNSDSLESIDSTLNSSRYLRQAQVWDMSNFGHSRSSEDVSVTASGRSKFKKGFSLRNMSVCMVDGMKEILQWRSSAEPLLDAGQGKRSMNQDSSGSKSESEVRDRWSHKLERLRLTRSSSAKVELLDIQREGTLRYMVADDSNSVSSTQWQKCRLLLRKAVRLEGERFLLEFYVPPKSTKPRVSIPLSAIVKVRTTMPLEMPDKDNTFVLKVENGAEYILETIDSLQKHSWVADIQDCMDPGDSEEDLELTSCSHAVSMPSRELPAIPPCSCDFLPDVSQNRTQSAAQLDPLPEHEEIFVDLYGREPLRVWREVNPSHHATLPAAPTQSNCRSDAHQSQHYFANSVAGSPYSAAQVEGTSANAHPAHPRSEAAISVRTNNSERLLQPQASTSEDYHDSDGLRNRSRAVENQYSFY